MASRASSSSSFSSRSKNDHTSKRNNWAEQYAALLFKHNALLKKNELLKNNLSELEQVYEAKVAEVINDYELLRAKYDRLKNAKPAQKSDVAVRTADVNKQRFELKLNDTAPTEQTSAEQQVYFRSGAKRVAESQLTRDGVELNSVPKQTQGGAANPVPTKSSARRILKIKRSVDRKSAAR